MFRPVGTPPPPSHASRPGSPHMLRALPFEVKQNDPLWGAQICKNFGTRWFHGRVVDVEADEQVGELAYCVEYEDGDSEHLSEREVRACLWRVTGAPGRPSCAPTPTPYPSRRSSLARGSHPSSPAHVAGRGTAFAQDDVSWRLAPFIVSGVLALFVLYLFWDYLASSPQQCTNGDALDLGGAPQADSIPNVFPFEHIGGYSKQADTSLNDFSFEQPKVVADDSARRHFNLDSAPATANIQAAPHDAHPLPPHHEAQPKVRDFSQFSRPDSDILFQAQVDQARIAISTLEHIPVSTSFDSPDLSPNLVDFERGMDTSPVVTEESSEAGSVDLDVVMGFIAFVVLVVAVAALCVPPSGVVPQIRTDTPRPVSTQPAPVSSDSSPQPTSFPLLRDPYSLPSPMTPSSRIRQPVVPSPVASRAPWPSPLLRTCAVPSPVPCHAPVVESSPVLPLLRSIKEDVGHLAAPQGVCQQSPMLVPTPSRCSALQSSCTKKSLKEAGKPREVATSTRNKNRLPSPGRFKYCKSLEYMKSMGFEDSVDLREALTLNQGRVSGALHEYLGN